MKYEKIALIATLAFLAGSHVAPPDAQAAFGYCTQPMAPSAFLHKPNKPYCAAARNCSEWDVQRYRNDVDSYYESLRRYAREVDDYYDDAARYIKCMSDLD
ncbi:hypothetical protein [Qipengyuania sp.]|uniref:hypothetical protein n=1 Tax=Qipengyuania sp. TaxID=2004515 RepID=UPI003AF8F641